MKKRPIGILDGGIEGINIFESLCNNNPYESFIYINDYPNYPYEGIDVEVIQQNVSKNIDILLSYNVSTIIVVSNSIIEYCDEYLNTLTVPVIKITDIVIDYVNTNYEHKNIAFIAKQYIIKANLYQKNFKYNHLYNIPSDDLEDLIKNRQIKTAYSFSKMQSSLKPINGKDINLVVYTDSYLKNLTIEFKEYIDNCSYIDLATILFQAFKMNNTIYEKKKGTNFIISDMKKKDFINMAYWIKCSYRFKNIVEIVIKKTGVKDEQDSRTNSNNKE